MERNGKEQEDCEKPGVDHAALQVTSFRNL